YGGVWNGKLIWGRLTHSRLLGVLANPSYAGAYVFGRYQSCKQIGSAGEIYTRSRPMPEEQWRVVIADHHPGYITWSNSSLIEDGWQRTGPTTKFLPGLLAKACVCFRACCFAAFAGIV